MAGIVRSTFSENLHFNFIAVVVVVVVVGGDDDVVIVACQITT